MILSAFNGEKPTSETETFKPQDFKLIVLFLF